MPIVPLPQFEADLLSDQQEREAYEKLKAPKTLVVRFGAMKMVGEFPWDSTEKPGCGSKIVVRTHRGVELGEMLTSTCSNNGCSKSVSRKDMLEYIENSGGRDYPFFSEGRALRVATREDMDRQARLEQSKHEIRTQVRSIAQDAGITVKIVDVEPILGGELLTVYYLSEERVDFRDLVPRLRDFFKIRVELKQVGARDEARITADYERCGQYCCCKNFLKVLKPISMKSAKVQKATLDPLKISGRCGRLMCCLRYEDETYESLKKNLPRKKSRVGTPEGDGIVLDAQILTQLVLVDLDEPDASGKPRQVAIPVENLTPPVDPVGKPRMPAPPPGAPRPPSGPGAGRPPRRDGAPQGGPPREQRQGNPPPSDGAPRSNPPRQGGPRQGQPNAQGQGSGQPRQGGPERSNDRNADRGQRPPRDQRRPRPQDEIIDLDDIETDLGDRPRRDDRGPRERQGGGQQGGPSSGPGGGQPNRGSGRGPERSRNGPPPEPREGNDGPDDQDIGGPEGSGPDQGGRRRRRRRRGGPGRGPGGPQGGPNGGPSGGPNSGPRPNPGTGPSSPPPQGP